MTQINPLVLALAMQFAHPQNLPVDPMPGRHARGSGVDPELRQYINHMRYEQALRAGATSWAGQEPNPFPLPPSMGGTRRRRR